MCMYIFKTHRIQPVCREDVQTLPVLRCDKYYGNIPVLQYNILAYDTSDARMCRHTSQKKLTYKTILIWLRVPKCHNISGYNITFWSLICWDLSNLFQL